MKNTDCRPVVEGPHLFTGTARGRANSGRTKLACLVYAAGATLAVLAWQATTVHFNYGGNWTGLFCTGDYFPAPPELAAGTLIFPASTGFDGEFYRYVAHDPWIHKRWAGYYDAAIFRYTRILVPALAWLLAFGRDARIDAAYIGVIALSVFLGVYWLGRWIALHGRSPAWGLGFLAMPATLVSIDRLTIDVALLALCAGVLWYSARGSAAALYALLAAAALARDTGLLLVAAYCMYAVSARLWRRAALFATAALPVLAWYIYLPAHLPVPPRPGSLRFFEYPVFGIFLKLFQPESYALSPWLARLAQAADEVALCGFLLALGYAAWTVLHRAYQLEDWIMLSFIGLAIAFSRPDYWNNIYNYGRPLSPLILLAAGHGLLNGRAWVLICVLMLDLRIGIQWGPQLLGILRGLT